MNPCAYSGICEATRTERDVLAYKLTIAVEALEEIMKIGTTSDGNTNECMIAYCALGKIESGTKTVEKEELK